MDSTVLKNFIVLEGLDGSGTTTQLRLLEKLCTDHGRSCFATWEPSPLPPGLLIRQALRKEIRLEPETIARLFSADRFEHLHNPENGIIARLAAGETVICDRYLFSSLAYQSLDCSFDLVLSLNRFPLPEYLFFLDLPHEVCRSRRSGREQEELFEDDSIQQQIIRNYKSGIEAYSGSGMKIFTLDGTRKPEDISAEIFSIISR